MAPSSRFTPSSVTVLRLEYLLNRSEIFHSLTVLSAYGEATILTPHPFFYIVPITLPHSPLVVRRKREDPDCLTQQIWLIFSSISKLLR